MKFNLMKFWLSFLTNSFGIVGDEGGGPGEGNAGDEGAADKGNEDKGDGKGEGEGGTDDKNKPTDAEAKLLKEVMDRKRAQKAAQEKLDELNAKLKEYEGLDVKKVRELLAEKEKAEEEQLAQKGEWQRLKERMAEEHTKALEAVNSEMKAVKEDLEKREKLVLDLTIGSNFSNSKFIAEEMTMTPAKVRQLYGAHFEIEDGQVVGYDKPAIHKDRTPLVDARGEPLSFEQALEKIIKADPDSDTLIRSKIKPGSKSTTDNKGKPTDVRDDIKGVSRISAGLKKASGK